MSNPKRRCWSSKRKKIPVASKSGTRWGFTAGFAGQYGAAASGDRFNELYEPPLGDAKPPQSSPGLEEVDSGAKGGWHKGRERVTVVGRGGEK
ncbi:5'-nucleotidase [Anopheles sinensis]|uniref:5'-nucleotidase n=1 Tax=Anopheles sinensis TaxID=74873 RepID=A0A084WHP6_ANOSI|nr:5'-nucleotidase [Anopheles sinensis]